MSFKMFASGTCGYRHPEREHVDFDDVYRLADVLEILTAPPRTVATGAFAAVEFAADPPMAREHMMNAFGRVAGLHLLNVQLTALLAVRSPVHISVNARRARRLWVDDSLFVQIDLDTFSHPDPVGEFLRTVTPILVTTELNTFGVLALMGQIFSEYIDAAEGCQQRHRILMQVSN